MKPEQSAQYLDMMDQWLILKQEEKSIDRYIRRRGWHFVAVYGMAIYGRHVIRELERTDLEIVYCLDRRKMEPYRGIKVLEPIGKLPSADVIINTVLYDHVNIKSYLAKITDIPVVCLDDVVFESY